MSKTEELLREIYAAIGLLALFNSNLNLGDSLRTILQYYSLIRNHIFIFFDWLNIGLTDQVENLITFILIFTLSCAIRGIKYNQMSVLIFIGSLLLSIFGVVVFGLGWFLSEEGNLFYALDDDTKLSWFQLIKLILSFNPMLSGSLMSMAATIGALIVLFPWLIAILSQIRIIKEFFFGFFEETFSIGSELSKKYLPKNTMSLLDTNADNDKLFDQFISTWPIRDYINYYFLPLRKIVFLALCILLFCKFVDESQ